jgi:hypothetical protein
MKPVKRNVRANKFPSTIPPKSVPSGKEQMWTDLQERFGAYQASKLTPGRKVYAIAGPTDRDGFNTNTKMNINITPPIGSRFRNRGRAAAPASINTITKRHHREPLRNRVPITLKDSVYIPRPNPRSTRAEAKKTVNSTSE